MTTRELEQLDIVYVDHRHRRRQSLSSSSSSSIEMSPCRVSKWIKMSNNARLRYRCSSCCYISARKSNVARHFDRKHIELKKPKKCSVCFKTFKTKGEYHDHTERQHQHLWPSSTSDEVHESDFSQIILRSSNKSKDECMQKLDQEMDSKNNNSIYTESLEKNFTEDSEHSSMSTDSCSRGCGVLNSQPAWNSTRIDSLPFSKKYQQAEKEAVMALLILHCPDYYLRIQDSSPLIL